MTDNNSEPVTDKPQGLRGRLFSSPLIHRFFEQRLAVAALILIALILLICFAAPLLGLASPTAQNLTSALQGPSGDHWFGTDELGRDQFSRFIFGGRTTMLAAFQAVIVSLLIGLPLGLVAGYVGGTADLVLSKFNDALMAAPSLVLAVAVVAVLGPGLTNAMLAIGLVMSPSLFRIVRSSTIQVRSETFIEGCRAIGCTPIRIMRKHVLLNIIPPVAVQVTILLGIAMLAEASLSFLGLGVRPPDPSWGGMLRTAFDNIYTSAFHMYPPGIAIGVSVLAFSQVGDGIREVFSTGRKRS